MVLCVVRFCFVRASTGAVQVDFAVGDSVAFKALPSTEYSGFEIIK